MTAAAKVTAMKRAACDEWGGGGGGGQRDDSGLADVHGLLAGCVVPGGADDAVPGHAGNGDVEPSQGAPSRWVRIAALSPAWRLLLITPWFGPLQAMNPCCGG